MGHCILFLSVVLITLVAFSSGKQYDMQPLLQDVHIILNEKTPKQTP